MFRLETHYRAFRDASVLVRNIGTAARANVGRINFHATSWFPVITKSCTRLPRSGVKTCDGSSRVASRAC